MHRRSFLRGLLCAPVAAALAVKATTDPALAGLTISDTTCRGGAWSVVIDANGYVSGYEMLPEGQVLTVYANEFTVSHGDGPIGKFTIGSVGAVPTVALNPKYGAALAAPNPG
jgi:hypothetical protein